MNGKPYQIRSGEIDFQRIPVIYWKQRLKMAKAMGLNTVATYVFWNEVEPYKEVWNFKGANNLQRFIRTAGRVGLNVILRPGPYVCGERDFGGLPAWLLRDTTLKVRCMNPYYMQNVGQYVAKLSAKVRDLQNTRGGPIILWQIENEYGSYGNDHEYMQRLVTLWHKHGINVPFFTADGAGKKNIEGGSLPGLAIGLDPGVNEKQYKSVEKWRPGVPVFCSEYYPGWFTPWRGKWASVGVSAVAKQIKWFMAHDKSFNLYMFNGGTNFGFTAGANYNGTYVPDVTSYDYDAPLNEMGQTTPKYYAIRKIIQNNLPPGAFLPKVPKSPTVITIPDIHFSQSISLLNDLPKPIYSVQTKSMEEMGQNYGYILYETKLHASAHGLLKVIKLHDFATVFLGGKFMGTLDRSRHRDTLRISLVASSNPTLDILVEAMGRINFGNRIIDRKGITSRVMLNNTALKNWKIYRLPMDSDYLKKLRFTKHKQGQYYGTFFKATFRLSKIGETYFDMSKWKKGVLWVNGHNLGRYWNVGPQTRLYCPASWLKKGWNTLIVFDMLRKSPEVIKGVESLEN